MIRIVKDDEELIDGKTLEECLEEKKAIQAKTELKKTVQEAIYGRITQKKKGYSNLTFEEVLNTIADELSETIEITDRLNADSITTTKRLLKVHKKIIGIEEEIDDIKTEITKVKDKVAGILREDKDFIVKRNKKAEIRRDNIIKGIGILISVIAVSIAVLTYMRRI